jgi:type II secretory pathway pseudopilin PulG
MALTEMRRSGFTLIELMVVIGCAMLLLLPAWEVFRQGTKSSLQGKLQIETTLEARRILQQVSFDLKNSCWAWDDEHVPVYTINQILNSSGGAFPNCVFSFLSFSLLGNVEDAISKTPDPRTQPEFCRKLWRRPSKITYRLEKSPKIKKEGYPPNFPMYSLIREERLNSKLPEAQKFQSSGFKRKMVLSERVMMFDITPYTLSDSLGNQQQFFWITLQLIDTVNRAGDFSFPTSGKLTQRSKDLVIADFFEVVSPKFLASYRQMAGPTIGHSSDYSRVSYNDPIDPEKQP